MFCDQMSDDRFNEEHFCVFNQSTEILLPRFTANLNITLVALSLHLPYRLTTSGSSAAAKIQLVASPKSQ